jgi:tetratricopeptide (TPR) repeat protein
MDSAVRLLFHEVADLTRSEREKLFAERQVPPELRAEIESLLSFDSTSDHGLTQRVAKATEDLLDSDHNAESVHWGPYRRVRILGVGGMGTVYLAERTDGEIQQQVAVKVLRADVDRPAWHDRFLKERQLLASLNHPSIAHLIDAGRTADGRPYLVMEYVNGVPIDVHAEGMDLVDQLTLFLRVCEGVSHAHRHLIIHRDLKPSNILVDASGQPKLLDFGIAKLLDETGDPTQTVDRLLTPNYASPEQLRGTTETTASDVYSLGAVLYKILTGRSPHESESGTLQAIDVVLGTKEIPAPSRLNPKLPSDVDYILRKALRSEPEARYASVETLANDIRAFLEWRPVYARSGDAWYRCRKFLRRFRVPVAAILLLLVGLSLGLYEVNRERAIAQRRFQQVRQLANKVIALDNVIAGLPGATKARNEIVAMSKEYLEGLAVEGHADPNLALEIATAYLSLSKVQMGSSLSLGLYAEAEESLIKAESFVDAVLSASPGNRQALATSAEINHNRMNLVDAENRSDAALAYAGKTAARLDALLRLGDASKSEMQQAARFFSNISLTYKNAHLYEESIRYARRSLEIARSQSFQESFPNTLSVMADSLRFSGDMDGALKTIREARTLVESTDYSTESSRAFATNAVLFREGMILGQDGQVSLEEPAEAITVLQRALDLMDGLAERDPSESRSRTQLGQDVRELGPILAQRDPEKALAVYDRGILRLREVKNVKAQRAEAQLLAMSSYVLRRVNRVNEAKQRIDAALKLLSDTKDYPADRVFLLDETEVVLRAWGAHLSETGQTQRAVDVYQELLDKVMATHPDPTNDLRNATGMSRIYEALATLHLRNGNAVQAQSMSALRFELWQNWNRKLPQNVYVQHQLEAASHR